MKAFLRPLFLGALAASLGFFTACDKSESDIRPTINTPQTGNLSGQVLPASAVTSVTAWYSGSQMTVIPNENGEYHFKDLTAGKWYIRFNQAPGYASILPEETRVNVGTTSKVAPAFFETNTEKGVWWLMDGAYQSGCGVSTSTSDNFVSFSDSGLSVNLRGINTSPMSFPLGNYNSDIACAIYFRTTNKQGITQQWTSEGGSGSVQVSVYGTNPRRVSGTFTCLAMPDNKSTTASKQISGKFTNIPF